MKITYNYSYTNYHTYTIETEIPINSKIYLDDNIIPVREYSSLDLPFQKVDKKEDADYIVLSDMYLTAYTDKTPDIENYKYTTTYFIIQSYINSIDFNLIEAFSNEELENIKNLNQDLKDSLLESCWLKLLKSYRECIVKRNLINSFFPLKINRKKEEFRRRLLIGMKRTETRLTHCKILW